MTRQISLFFLLFALLSLTTFLSPAAANPAPAPAPLPPGGLVAGGAHRGTNSNGRNRVRPSSIPNLQKDREKEKEKEVPEIPDIGGGESGEGGSGAGSGEGPPETPDGEVSDTSCPARRQCPFECCNMGSTCDPRLGQGNGTGERCCTCCKEGYVVTKRGRCVPLIG